MAASRNVPSHTLVTDKILHSIVDAKPRTREDLLGIEGMGPVTFQRCGRELLGAIEDHFHEQKLAGSLKLNKEAFQELPAAMRSTWELAERGLSITDIAVKRGLTEGTISNHLSEMLRRGMKLKLEALVSKAHQDQVRGAFRKLRDGNLKKIKAMVDDDINYAEIRIMLAVFETEKKG
jgi:ATP-dependent DNA helicase RecQ